MEGYEVLEIMLMHHSRIAKNLINVSIDGNSNNNVRALLIKSETIKEIINEVLESIERPGDRESLENKIRSHFDSELSNLLWKRKFFKKEKDNGGK